MDDLLQQGITAYKAGKRDEARNIFITVVKQSSDSEPAWSWLYEASGNDEERIYCLKQILRINPKHEKANQLINLFTGNAFPLESHSSLPPASPTQTTFEAPSTQTGLGRVSMVKLQCPSCGGELELPSNLGVAHCLFCGAKILLQKHDDYTSKNNIQLNKVLEEGAILTAMTKQGVNIHDFGKQLAETRAAYNLALSMRPENFTPDAKTNLDNAFKGWDLTLYLWNAKNDELDNPVEPDINKYEEFIAYAGDKLIFEVHPSNFIVENYRNKKHLSFENISILLSVASDYFQNGQMLLQQEMR